MSDNDESDELVRHYQSKLSNEWRTLNDPALVYVTELKDMEMPRFKNAKAILGVFYKSLDHNQVRFASMWNSMCTQGTSIFIMNRTHIDNLMKADNDQRYNSIDDKAYKSLIRFLLSKGIIEQLRAPSPFGTKGPRLAGVYRLIDPGLLAELDKIVGATFRVQHEKDFMKWQFETGIEYKTKEPTDEQKKYLEDIKRRAEEKRKLNDKT